MTKIEELAKALAVVTDEDSELTTENLKKYDEAIEIVLVAAYEYIEILQIIENTKGMEQIEPQYERECD